MTKKTKKQKNQTNYIRKTTNITHTQTHTTRKRYIKQRYLHTHNSIPSKLTHIQQTKSNQNKTSKKKKKKKKIYQKSTK